LPDDLPGFLPCGGMTPSCVLSKKYEKMRRGDVRGSQIKTVGPGHFLEEN